MGLNGSAPDVAVLADKVSAAWTAFAHSGNPNVSSLPHWPAYDTTSRATMVFNDDCKEENDPAATSGSPSAPFRPAKSSDDSRWHTQSCLCESMVRNLREIAHLTGASFVAIMGDRMVDELNTVVAKLGGPHAFGRKLSSDRDLREAIREGFPWRSCRN